MMARPLHRRFALLGTMLLGACSAEAVSKEPLADAGDPDLPHYRIVQDTRTDGSFTVSPDGRYLA
ncbi:MAG: hypothetical protein RLN75_03775, partial [Longimicrobiales bacterium]